MAGSGYGWKPSGKGYVEPATIPGPTIKTIEAKFDRDDFKRSIHWLYEDGNSDTLFVTSSTVGHQPGRFNGYKTTRGFPESLLFLADPENLFYNKLADLIAELICDLHLAKRFRKVVYWGSSMGAYASVLLSVIGPKTESYAYAFAPAFNLLFENTSAAPFLRSHRDSLDRRFTDLIPMLRANHCKRYGLIPCYDWQDGAQVRDLCLIDPGAHALQVVGTSHKALEDIIAASGRRIYNEFIDCARKGENISVPEEYIPSVRDRDFGIEAYACIEFVDGRGECPDLEIDDTDTKNHGWLNAKVRALQKKREYLKLIDAGIRSIALSPNNIAYVACLANGLESSGDPVFRGMAEGLYRHIARLDPRSKTLLERQLTSRGYSSEI